MKRNVKIEINDIFLLSAINRVTIIRLNEIGECLKYPTIIADAKENYVTIETSHLQNGVYGFEIDFTPKEIVHIRHKSI